MKRLTASWIALLAVICCQADAQDGGYVSVLSGWVFLDDYNGEQEGPPVVARTGTFDEGWALGGAIGKHLGDGCRGELEFTYRSNSGEAWTVGPVIGPYVTSAFNGHFNSYAGMANLFHDFNSLGLGPITPYLGGGIGFAILDGKFTNGMGTELAIDNTEFAFQGMAGLNTNLTQNLTLFTEYRYFGTTEASLQNLTAGGVLGDFSYKSNNVLIGLRLDY